MRQGVHREYFGFVAMIEWHIQSRAHVCQVSGRHFTDGETYHTVLIASKVGFERIDLCAQAFRDSGAEILARPGLVSHWKGTYEPPPAVPPEAIRKDDAESLLRKLLEKHDGKYAAVSYILAVMLERKRILRVKAQSREGGRRVFIYEHPKSGDLFTIADPDLQLAQLETVQHDLSRLLEHGLPPEEEVALVPVLADGPTEEPFNPPSEISTLAPI